MSPEDNEQNNAAPTETETLNTPQEPKKDSSKSKKLLIVSAVLLVVAAGIFAYFAFNSESEPIQTTATTVTVQEEPAKEELVVKPEEINLKAIAPYSGTAQATRIFSENKFTHTVTATTVDPAEGKFYEGWLVVKQPELKFISTGKLSKQNGKYKLTYTSDTDRSNYPEVVITEETLANGLDGKPEAHIFEGSF
jgi:hypothetical protein